jgi:Flp pilus assembly protein TadD
MGEAQRSISDLSNALESFRTARDLDPANAVPDLNLAMLYEQMGRLDDARKCYEDVIRIQPDNAEALNNLAYLKADTGADLDQALALAQRARDKRPGDPNVIDTVALIYIRKNLTEDSVRMLRDLVHEHPENASFHLHLAMALYQKGDRILARKELEAAQRRKPSERDLQGIRQLLAKVG